MNEYILSKKIPLPKGNFHVRHFQYSKSGVVFTTVDSDKAKKFKTKEDADSFIYENDLRDWEIEKVN